jgi:hypothetical protein
MVVLRLSSENLKKLQAKDLKMSGQSAPAPKVRMQVSHGSSTTFRAPLKRTRVNQSVESDTSDSDEPLIKRMQRSGPIIPVTGETAIVKKRKSDSVPMARSDAQGQAKTVQTAVAAVS